jgi:hypothetical protein
LDREYSIADYPFGSSPGRPGFGDDRVLTHRHRTYILKSDAQVFAFLRSTQDNVQMKNRTSQRTTPETDLQARKAELVRRLQDGDEQITSAKRDGADTTRWENHWITLLRQYESVCREISESGDQYPAAA